MSTSVSPSPCLSVSSHILTVSCLVSCMIPCTVPILVGKGIDVTSRVGLTAVCFGTKCQVHHTLFVSQCYPHQCFLSQRRPLSSFLSCFSPLLAPALPMLRQSHPPVAQRPATGVRIFATALLETSLSSVLMIPTQSALTIVSSPLTQCVPPGSAPCCSGRGSGLQ